MYLKTLDRAFRVIFIIIMLVGMMGVPEARVSAGSALGLGDGLYAEYRDLGGSTVIHTVNGEGPINHGWNNSCPGDNMYQNECGLWAGMFNAYSVLEETLTGYIEAPATGHYVFHSGIDDYLDITIHGVNQIVDGPAGGGYSIELDLVEGGFYPVTMNFKNRWGSANVSLFWTLPDSTFQIVPKQYLYTDAPGQSKVGLVTSVGGVGDNALNWMANEGLLQAQTDFGIVGTLYESTSEADYAALLQQCATDGNSLCFAVSFLMADAVTAAANTNPDVKFALLDYVHESPPANLRSINFDEKQVGYLAGALAGKMTASNKIGAVGGMDIPPVTAFMEGYRNGAQCANPDVIVTAEYMGTFTDTVLGTQVAQTMLSNSLDIVYGVAGPAGSAAILYAAQNGGWSIGVDVDEYLTTFGSGSVTGSDKLLTSTMKKIDFAVWKTISDHMSGAFTSGQTTYHLAEGGVGLAPYHETDAGIPQGTKDYVDGVQAGILGGSIDINETCRSSAWDVVAEGLSGPFHMDFDEAGNLYVANEMGEGVSKITPDGTLSLFSGGLGGASGLEFNASGVLFVSDDTNRVFQLDGAGNQTVFVDSTAGLSNPNAIAFDDQNNLYAVSAGGFVSKFAPDGTLLDMYLADSLNLPEGVVVDNAAGKIYVSDYNGNVFEIDMAAGGKTLYAQTNAQTEGGLARDAEGNIYLSAIGSGVVYRIDALTHAADVCLLGVNSPRGLTFGPDGRLYVTEYWRGRILSAAGCSSELPPGYQLTPSFSVWFNQNKVDSYGWPYQTDVTLTIEDNSTPASPDFTSTLNTEWTPWASFELGSQFQLQHGQVVTMTDGSTTRTHTITDLVVTGISTDANLVTGTAAAGSEVRIENKHNGNIWRHEIAALDGSWTANFNVPGDEEGEIIAEINPGDEFHVGQWDEDGDGTWWYLPVANPSFSARLVENEVDGYEWPLGVNVTLTIDDPDNGPGVDFSDTRTVGNPDGEPNHQTLVHFELGGFTLEPYQLVTLTDGFSSRSTLVASLAVTNVNPDADTVTGTADPGTQVDMGHLYCNESGCYGYRREIADAGGNWTANFAVPGEDPDEQDLVDITPGMGSEARTCDADGDCTRYSWNLKNTNFSARLSENQVHGYEWPLGAEVTITIDDPDNGEGVDFSATQPSVVADWDPNQTFVRFELGGFTLQPYQLVTLSDGTLTRSTTVANLVVTSANATTDTISGTADPGTQVDVGHLICDQYGCTGFRREIADAGGNWAANFSVPGEDPDEQDIVDITPGMGNEARVRDADGDWTTYQWYVYNPNMISRLGQNRVEAYDWPAGTQVTLTIDDPNTGAPLDYTATIPTILNDPNNVFSGTYADFDFGGVYLLKSGDLVTVTGEGATKTTIVADLHVTSVDADTDIITGTAGPGIDDVSVRIWGLSFEMRRDVTVSGGAWVADFSTPTSEFEAYDLKPGDRGAARWWDDDGDMTTDFWQILNPFVEASPRSNWIHARDWPLGTLITLEIDDPSNGVGVDYTATDTVHQAPWNPGDPNDILADFNWPDQFAPGAGYIITASGNGISKTLVVSNLRATAYDVDLDTVSGVATPGAGVEVCVNFPDHCALRRVTADPSTGAWTADYAHPGTEADETEIVDIQPGTNGWAAEYEADWDRTWYDWNVPNPHFSARLTDNEVHGYEWPLGANVTITIDDPDNGTGVDFSDTQPSIVADWDPNQTFVPFALGVFTLEPGQFVTMGDGITTRTHTVKNLVVTSADPDTDTVSGTADAGSEIHIGHIYCDENGCFGFRRETADANGDWAADFSVPGEDSDEGDIVDIKPGMGSEARIPDEDGDSTQYGWYIPNPIISVRANFNEIEAYEWPMGSTITLEIDDPVTPENPDYSTTRLVDEVAYWNPSQTYEWFQLEGIFDIQPGFTVSMTDGLTTKTHTVTNLAFTEMNIDNDTVTGQAFPEGVRVDVWACANNHCVNRHAFADAGGAWTVDFATPGTEPNEQEIMDLVNGTWVDSAQYDEDNDMTMFGQSIPNPRLNAFINGNAVEFYEFGGMEITLNIDDPGTPEPVDYTYTGPASNDWRLEIGESFTLAAGHIITVTGTGVNKTLAVADISVTGWDMYADTLSGTAPAGTDLWVYGNSLGVDAWRRFTTEGGAWLADFSTLGDEDFEQTTLNIVNGSYGDARVDDADNDSTTYNWNVYTAWIAPETVPFVVGMSQYVDLARPSYTLEAWSALNLLYEPFYRVTQEGTLLPAAALGHAVSPDGLVYTLTLRDDMLWSDGEPVTAQHYVDGFLRILAPATTTDYASLLYYDILGAEAFNNGTETDPNTVGITATGPHTLQFTMIRPAAHFPHVLSVPGFFPVRQDLINLYGNAWVDPANFAASGPYDLLEYDGTHLLFGKNPLYYAAGGVDFTQIGMPFIPDVEEQFAAYKRGEVDTVIGASNNALADPAYNAERVYSAIHGVIGIGLNTLRAPTDNPLVRKALAAGTNRQALFDAGLLPPWFQKATGLIPPELPGYQGSEAGYEFNLAQAQDLLTQAGYPGGTGLPTVYLYGTPNRQEMLEAIAGQWTADLGISVEVKIIGDQWGYINDCMGIGIENCDYNAFRSGWYVDYFDAYSLVGDFITFHLAPRTGWDDPNYQDWLDAARSEQNPTLRIYALRQAEQWVVNDGVPFIPVYHAKQVNLVKPGITTAFGIVPYFEQWSYHPPITAVDDAYAAVEDTLLSVDAASGLLANDINSDGEPLWVHDIGWSVSGATIGVANQEGSFTYEPPANFCGPDSFTYTATDGGGVSNTATVSLDVACVNDAPRAYPFTVFVEKNASWPISLAGSDADSDPLTFTVLSDPAHGVLSGTAPALTYTPALNYLGSDSFTFKVNDGLLDSLPATITIQVTNVVLPVTPSSFYGEIHILDNPPSPGAYVEAYIPGVSGPVANAVVTNYAGTLIYNINVPAGAQGMALEGALVTFKIEDRVVATGTWHSGTQVQLDLHPPQALEGGPYTGDEGSSISFAGLADDWGADALTWQWDWDNDGTFDATGQDQVHTWSDDGSHPVTLKVIDGQGGEGFTQFTVTVQEVPPTNVSAGGPYSGTAGQPVSLGGSATCVPGDGCAFAWDLDNDSFFDDATGLSASRTWNEAGDYTVSLQASDDDGNVLTSSANVHITGAVHSLALVQGWNLVSFNLHPADTGISAVLSSLAGNYDLVYAWDATGAHAGSGNWLRYAPALPPALNTLAALDERMGFWIHMTAADTLDVTGNVPSTTNINLSTAAGGWNLVSYPASVNRDLPYVLSLYGVGTDFSLIYAYHANEAGDPWKLYNRTIPAQFNDLTFLSPGWGYWIRISADHTWSVNYLP